MDSLNPHWLSIELDSIDDSTDKWNAALQTSYEASFRLLTEDGVTLSHPQSSSDSAATEK